MSKDDCFMMGKRMFFMQRALEPGKTSAREMQEH